MYAAVTAMAISCRFYDDITQESDANPSKTIFYCSKYKVKKLSRFAYKTAQVAVEVV